MRGLFSTPSDDIFSGGNNDNWELLKAWAGSTLAFAIFQTGAANLLSSDFVRNLLISAVVCGLAFVLHELAHRVVARGYGAEAHFKAEDRWLLISIAIALAGLFIAAPGAVWHRGYLTPRQSGLIALAGPVTNLVLAVVFVFGLVALAVLGISPFTYEWLYLTCLIGFKFNAWIGLFNMIPAGPFDGAKVLAWDWRVFAVTVAVALVMTFVITDVMIFDFIGGLLR